MSTSLDLRHLSDLALDAFRELGNIGSGHASGALATMLGRKVDITVPKVQLLAVARLDDLCPEQTETAAVHLRLTGDIEGVMAFCVPARTAEDFIRHLTGQALTIEDELGVSVIAEIANIVGGAFLSAFYGMTGLNAALTPPQYHTGGRRAAFTTVLEEIRPWGDYAFVVETTFLYDGTTLPCSLFFIPRPAGMVSILERLGLQEIFSERKRVP
ncbi:MAG TPA: hypothetical protein GXX28_04190 [Firmicutes bacterium]|nr:hypothetical protein [Bacillota bacterium]